MTTNPALADVQFLTGAWDMEVSEASFLPDPDAKVHGSVAAGADRPSGASSSYPLSARSVEID